VQLLKREIPQKARDPLRYLGAIVILVSPTFHIVGGSWPHLVSLLVASVGIVLLAIALRVRALMYAGAGFLMADLVAMVVRGSLAHPNLLWIVGLGVGAFVVALAAICENRREQLQQRLRIVSAALRQWECGKGKRKAALARCPKFYPVADFVYRVSAAFRFPTSALIPNASDD
jgi:hypothetical protein